MARLPDPMQYRQADYPIEPLFLKRWSPRAMSGEPLSRDALLKLFDAARWAPSTYNEQEWRFLYAMRDSQHWDMFFDFLVEANQAWCDKASALIVVVSHKVFSLNGKPNPVHTFDTGAAFENLALQGAADGLVVHGMAGFDRARVKVGLNIPDDYQVEAMIAVGLPGDPDQLDPVLREREIPTGRKPIEEIAREGLFKF